MSTFGESVRNRIATGRSVVAALEEHHDQLAPGLESVGPLDRSGWERWIEDLKASLEQANERLFEAENALAAERGNNTDARNRRDEAAEEVQALLMEHRQLLETVGGESAVSRFNLGPPLPRTPERIATDARNSVDLLRDATATYNGPGEVNVETTNLADDLESAYDELRSAIDTLESAERREDTLLVERNESLEHWKQVYRSVASMVEGALRFAGEEELADRLRPTARRTSGRESPDDVETPDIPGNTTTNGGEDDTAGDTLPDPGAEATPDDGDNTSPNPDIAASGGTEGDDPTDEQMAN